MIIKTAVARIDLSTEILNNFIRRKAITGMHK